MELKGLASASGNDEYIGTIPCLNLLSLANLQTIQMLYCINSTKGLPNIGLWEYIRDQVPVHSSETGGNASCLQVHQ